MEPNLHWLLFVQLVSPTLQYPVHVPPHPSSGASPHFFVAQLGTQVLGQLPQGDCNVPQPVPTGSVAQAAGQQMRAATY